MTVMNSPWHVSTPGWPVTAEQPPHGWPARERLTGEDAPPPGVGEQPHRSGPAGDESLPGATENVPVSRVTAEGAAWLVSAGTYPHATLSRWAREPDLPLTLPCGITFDVVNVPAFFGRRMLDRLWADGPGSGPVAVHRGRMLLFAAPGTAQRLPSLLRWEEWGAAGGGRGGAVPPLLCHGSGDAVTVPPLAHGAAAACAATETLAVRWLVAPATRRPWLPGPEVLLWACVRAARATAGPGTTPQNPAVQGERISIFPRADQGASVYDVSRRR